jgi:hypothetical protein
VKLRHPLVASSTSQVLGSQSNARKPRAPSDAEIERGLRERAVSDPRAAEILLRWLQRPRPLAPEDDALEALSVDGFRRKEQPRCGLRNRRVLGRLKSEACVGIRTLPRPCCGFRGRSQRPSR